MLLAIWLVSVDVAQASSPDPVFVVAQTLAVEDYDPLFEDEFEDELNARPAGFPDPFEGINRGVLRFNRIVDRYVLDPVTRLYDIVIPEPAKPAMRRVFQHYGSTSILLNDLLQVRFRDAGKTVVRFVVNSTTGVGGLFDFARCASLENHRSDFGQTLARYGVGSGFYLLLPVLGPTTVRDAFGDVVDGLLHPARYLLGPAQQLTYGSSAGLATRERHYRALNELESSAVDFYAALRNAFYQARTAEIEQGVDRDMVVPLGSDSGGRCTRTLEGGTERTIGPPVALGLAARPVSRWRPRAAVP